MPKVLLINHDKIPHYRVPVYNYISEHLKDQGFLFSVISGGIQKDNPHKITFKYLEVSLSLAKLAKCLLDQKPDAVIFWVNLRYAYLFPLLLFLKTIGLKVIYWGHGRDLEDVESFIKNFLYLIEHWFCDAIILYAGHLKKYVNRRFHKKTFIANNTLNFDSYPNIAVNRHTILSKYNIHTRKNIICMARVEKRKRIDDLIKAFRLLNRRDFGLILVGPDKDEIINDVKDENIYKLGPIFGDESIRILCAADIYCLPGHIGLSIVDAFYCGLPIITENTIDAPEVMYLKPGKNGFVVREGDIRGLAAKLQLLLEDDNLRFQFSKAAKNEIMTNGHVRVMSEGFSNALRFVFNQR